jgi:hypothetical protein
VVLIWVYYSAQLVLMGDAGSADRQSSGAKAVAVSGAHPA